jgi:3-deoxy-D-manno-octulosonic-acid transferase
MPSTSLSYRALARAGVALAPAFGLVDRKIREGHGARHGAEARLRGWAERARDRARPLVWFHASSVGEGLQAESVLGEVRSLIPGAQYVYTHFSPSATTLARALRVDVADYLPYDLPQTSERLLAALAPDLLVFSKLDLWPELATRAAARGAAVALVAATVSPASGRLRWPARQLLQPGYVAVDAAAAVSGDDAARLGLLGVRPGRTRISGDPRYDSVAARVRGVPHDDPLLRFGLGAPTIVAGSTWPGDDAVLLKAFARLRTRHPEARLILAPHEPTAPHLAALERAATRAGLSPVRLSAAAGPVSLLLVDRVGVLATMYGGGAMAYVGGGFGRAGLHSVLEPAAWGLPVAFGPRWSESRDAGLLLDARAAMALPLPGTGKSAAALVECWEGWIGNASERMSAGGRARAVVDGGLGAARRSAELLAEITSSRLPRRSPTAAR